jgi:hypothetical protein
VKSGTNGWFPDGGWQKLPRHGHPWPYAIQCGIMEIMKRCLVVIATCAVMAMGLGCASNGWRAEQVPLPTATPFDANQMARNAYLEGFREGFRAQQNKSNSIELVGGPHREAKLAGFRAGAAEARSRQTGEVAPASPVTTGR